MKILKLTIIAVLVSALTAFAQPGAVPVGDSYTFLAGEHTPVIYSGSGTVSVAHTLTTQWLQIGYSPNAAEVANSNLGRFNPEKFTVGVKLACSGSGDSARVTTARFEEAYDTTIAAFWNADSSNIFIKSGNYGLQDYGVWRFEVLADTSHRQLYALRVLQGGYVRLVFQTTTADTASLSWTLTGEH